MLRASVLAALVEVGLAAPLDEKFDAWVMTHNKVYATSESRAQAYRAFVANDERYVAHNKKGKSYTLGHNQFSDLTPEEFSKQQLGCYVDPHRVRDFDMSLLNVSAPTDDALDWVKKGAVTPVKNQAQCGSCWSFSTTGSVEGAYQIATGTLLSLSEQELVSCDHGSNGCQGGSMDQAIQWIETNPLCLESDYPYTSGGGQSGQCKTSCQGKVTVTGLKDVPANENALMAALLKGPVSIAIEADKSAFQGYNGGILDNPACGKQLDHGVLLVAYGTDKGTQYWKIKNSWGATWGEEGYIRFIRGKDQCGLADQAVYPVGAENAKPGPSPGPSPGPGPSPSPGGKHYEQPPCSSDEMDGRIAGGEACFPSCDTGSCPAAPDGVTAHPECAVQDQSGNKYCGLICSGDDQCASGATCADAGGASLCVYSAVNNVQQLELKLSSVVV